MKEINYVIERYLFTEYEEKLAEAAVRSGAKVYFYDELFCDPNFVDWVKKTIPVDSIVIFHGSLQHGKKMAHLPYYPGVFLTLENFECYNYYGYFGDYLLNSNYRMMGLNDVLRNKDKLFNCGQIFIRPSGGDKSFPGQTLSHDNFEHEFNLLINSYSGLDMNTLVVIADAQPIREEYRFIVIDGEVISGATYFDESNVGTLKPHYDKLCDDLGAWRFATKMSKIYQPDKAYTIDVCKDAYREYKLLEINSFNCASMYGCDYDKVVEASNKLAIKEYNDLFEI